MTKQFVFILPSRGDRPGRKILVTPLRMVLATLGLLALLGTAAWGGWQLSAAQVEAEQPVQVAE